MTAHAPAAGPHADDHAEAHDDHADTAEAPSSIASNRVSDMTFGTTNRIRGVVGNLKNRASEWDLKPIPAAPTWNAVGKAAALGAIVTMPHLAATAAVGGYVGSKIYKAGVKYTPLSYVDKAARSVTRTGIDMVKGAASVATYPLRVAGNLAMNTVRLGAKAAANTVAFGTDILTDIETAINVKSGLPSTTNLPAQVLIGGKNLVKGVLWDLPKGILVNFAKHPVAGTAIGLLGAGVLANAGMDLGVLGSAGSTALSRVDQLFNFVMSFLPK